MKRQLRLMGLVLSLAVVLMLGGNMAARAAGCETATNPATCACATANNPLSCACSTDSSGTTAGSAQSPSACTTNGSTNPIAGSHGVLRKTSLLLAMLGGIVAIIVGIISGLTMILANGDAQKFAGARNALIGAIVGIAIIAAAESIVIFVVSKV